MNHRRHPLVSVVAVVVAIGLLGAVQTSAQTDPPRTAWGQPDLQGVWDFRSITPMQRPNDRADQEFLTTEEAAELDQAAVERDVQSWNREARRTEAGGNVGAYNNFWMDRGLKSVGTRRTSLIVYPPNGRMPAMTPSGQERAQARRDYAREHPADSWVDRPPYDRCILGFNAGPPITPGGYNQNVQVFQTPDYVVLMNEMVHSSRVIPLDGQEHLPDNIRQWMGDSRGHWEEDTLVVETTNFLRETSFRSGVTTADLRLIERFTRVSDGTLMYDVTIEDPNAWDRPWSYRIPMQQNPMPLFEYACHEGNYGLTNILAGAREKEAAMEETSGR